GEAPAEPCLAMRLVWTPGGGRGSCRALPGNETRLDTRGRARLLPSLAQHVGMPENTGGGRGQ
ncbi:MAG: hypothetical protein ACYTFQ_29595, partial [Planctomycetota bacterium]